MKKQKTPTYQSDLQLDGTKFKIQSLAFIFLILMSQLRNLLDFSRTIVTQTKHKRETLDARQHQFKKNKQVSIINLFYNLHKKEHAQIGCYIQI